MCLDSAWHIITTQYGSVSYGRVSESRTRMPSKSLNYKDKIEIGCDLRIESGIQASNSSKE